jgi:hypothetical protein
MAHRTCTKCMAADNPLSRLRFQKSRVDGKLYCENCLPDRAGAELASAPSAPDFRPSAGLVVVNCPDCAGGMHRPHQKPCTTCAGYGAVRMEASMLNVYRPKAVSPSTEPVILMEEAPPLQ